jgi:hypothetical protein
MLAKDKRTSFSKKFINHGCKRLYNIGPRKITKWSIIQQQLQGDKNMLSLEILGILCLKKLCLFEEN